MTWQPELWGNHGLPAVANVAEASEPMTSPNGTKFRVVREGLELRTVKDKNRATNLDEADEAEERHSKPSQRDQILKHLKRGNRITQLDAWVLFRCSRLAARIRELRAMGHDVQSRMVETPSGKRVAEYYMEAA